MTLPKRMCLINNLLHRAVYTQLWIKIYRYIKLVEVTDSAVLGGVVEVVSSIPAVGRKIFFNLFRPS